MTWMSIKLAAGFTAFIAMLVLAWNAPNDCDIDDD